MISADLSEYEPFVDDARLERTFAKVRTPEVPDDTDVVTFIQPATARTLESGLTVPVAEMAVTMIISDHPKGGAHRVATTGTCSVADWRAREQEHRHYVGATDPLESILRVLLPRHLETLKNLREMT